MRRRSATTVRCAAFAAWVFAFAACSDPVTTGGAGADPTTSGPVCHALQRRPDDSCCPLGHFYLHADNECVAVGPPECADAAFSDPAGCVPRWCWSGESESGGGCDPVIDDDCRVIGRLCTPDELATGAGCGAGEAPDSDASGSCVPTGFFAGSGVPKDWDGDAATLPPVPPLDETIPPGVPPLTPLPDVEDTFFCRDEATAEPHFCSEAETAVCQRAADGSLPDPDRCVYVGVPWASRYCPPGFVVDSAAKVDDGQLPACKPDPADCPDGEYAGLGASAANVFVHVTKGDDTWPGTMALPVRSVAKALALTPAGGTVAVAPGTYTGSVTIAKAVTLRGHCAAQVSLVGDAGISAMAIGSPAAAGEVSVHGLRIGGPGYGVQVTPGLTAHLERVVVSGTRLFGVLVDAGGVLNGESLVIEGTLPRQSDGVFGRGVSVETGSRATLKDVRLRANAGGGFFAAGVGSELVGDRILIDGTLAQQGDGAGGYGGGIWSGAHVALQDARVSRNRNSGLAIGTAAASLTATRLLVDHTLPQLSDGSGGWAIGVTATAQVDLHEVRLSANRDSGIIVEENAQVLDGQHVLVDHTQARLSDGEAGRGVQALSGARVALRDVRLSTNREVGLVASDVGTEVTVDRLLVDGTLPSQSDKSSGMGADIIDGARVVLRDARLTANAFVGVFVDGGELDAAALVIDHTGPDASDGTSGDGLMATNGANVVLRAARMSQNRNVALACSGAGTRVVATALVVDGTLPQQSDHEFGRAIGVQFGADLQIRTGRLSANRETGLLSLGAGSRVSAVGVLIDGTLPQASDDAAGVGAIAQAGGELDLSGAHLVANRKAGLFALAGTVRLAGVTIADTEVQASDQTGGAGMWLTAASQVAVLASRLRGNHSLALAADKSAVVVRNSVLLDTAWSDHGEVDAAGYYTGKKTPLADGILLNAAPDAAIERCLLVAHMRAGVLIESSPGATVRSSLVAAQGGQYGIVVQHTPGVETSRNAVFGAALQDRATDAGLSLPAPPEPVKTSASGTP